MNLHTKPYHALCALQQFTINGIQAYESDFGSGSDEDPGEAEEYSCGDRRWRGRASTPEVLAKYGITQEEYDFICERLSSELSFGSCGWCQ